MRTSRVVFLDIDGVLNRCYRPGRAPTIDRSMLAHLDRILTATGAAVVLTSWWRLSWSVAHLQELLDEYGWHGRIIGETPDQDWHECSRGCEVAAWLAGHPEVTSWVILDDVDDMLRDQEARLVLTPDGLTEALAVQAVALLVSS